MSVSEAFVIGEEWISEHYFTTDATKESFKGRVLDRRKQWDEQADDPTQTTPSTRARFLTERGSLEKRLIAVAEGADLAAVPALYDDLLDLLGYRSGQFRLDPADAQSPVTRVRPLGQDTGPLAIVRAKPVGAVDEILAKDEPTLLTPWTPDPDDPTHTLTSVSTALSTLMVERDGPQFALVLAGRWCLIAEQERWPDGRWFAVDLQLVCERNDTKKAGEIDRALTCLEAASLAPDPSGVTWWRETLDASIKHTVGVSQDLRDGVRSSIEIIGNEVVHRRRAQGLDPLPADQAQPLAVQALRYLYRVLFLLYAEASPELGVLPVGAAEYDAGYGLDRLRDLALREVHTPQAMDGTHLYDSLRLLFELVDRGPTHTPDDSDGSEEGLEFRPLRADLFRPKATALIDEVGLGNQALLKVLRHLFLSKQGKGKAGSQQGRGFISYVSLGINQLGAVYEGLMSYTGIFAVDDMVEVAKKGDRTKGSWLVPVDRAEHLRHHFVQAEDEHTGQRRAVVHPKGSFVYRLSGRDRQRSASYYTPEVLTRFTVQQTLEELLDQDGETTTAEQILELTVCEPALGSGAFAIEAVRQLAEEYLRRRENELGERIDPEQRPKELQKVKAYLALHQVYGVDLNATAVELAEVSLWLDTMVEGLQAPWFGLRLRRGNSLVGARRAVYTKEQLKSRAWQESTPADDPLSTLAERVDSGGRVPVGDTRVHHFLLPALGWGSAVEVPKQVSDLAMDEVVALKAWRTEVRKSLTAGQVTTLQVLARRVERLWELALLRLRIAEQQSSRSLHLWGRDTPTNRSTVTRDQIEKSLADPDGAYRRLRLVMDAWCALWFWPLTERNTAPPTLAQWFDALGMILGGEGKAPTDKRAPGDTMQITEGISWEQLGALDDFERLFSGATSMVEVRDKHPWLKVVERVAEQQGFFHWELDFATVFARGGFDLQVGNPPWVRPDVDVDGLLADGDPWWALETKTSEAARNRHRLATLALPGIRTGVLDGCGELSVLGDFLTDQTQYPVLSGRPDLYRAFMSQAWVHLGPRGRVGLIHMESHFTDDKAQALRRESYRRLRRHWQFINELKLFDIDHHVTYGVNIYGLGREIDFLHATALYHPDTVERSLRHDGSGPEPGLKDDEGHWDTRAHGARVQRVTPEVLKLWARAMATDSWDDVPMVYTVNSRAANALIVLSQARRVGSLYLEFSAGWNEKTDRQKGRFESKWGEAVWRDAILQGPHLHVSTPLYKSPNVTMKGNQDWSSTDFESLAPEALPITAYKPIGSRSTYDLSYTHWGDDRVPARDSYRLAWRAMAANTGERTLMGALIPPGVAHIHGVASVADSDSARVTVSAATVVSTLLADFMVRCSPKSAITLGVLNRMPFPSSDHPLFGAAILRALRLNCVTGAYAEIWADCWDDGFMIDRPILARHDERPISSTWTVDTPLRRAMDRRNAQVEIDALVALMLSVPVDDLCAVYRTQFAVLNDNDRARPKAKNPLVFDRNGRVVPNEVLQVWRKKGDAITEEERTAVHPGSGRAYVYELPFGILDREADFRTAYAEFERRLAERS